VYVAGTARTRLEEPILNFIIVDDDLDIRRGMASLLLVAAGATFVEEQAVHLLMLRDPWGLALQLCKRAPPLLPVA
jgi:hypothetical protein